MKTSRKLFLLTIIGFLTVTSLKSQIYLTNSGTATFVSEAPLELISASSNKLQGAINVADNRFVFKIDNKSFIGFNSALQQEHFYENYIETEKYASSSFQGKIIETFDMNSSDVQNVRAKGILSIHGVEIERIINATLQIVNGALILKCDFKVPLEEHNIRIPNVVYQKIAEIIDVRVEAEMEQQPD